MLSSENLIPLPKVCYFFFFSQSLILPIDKKLINNNLRKENIAKKKNTIIISLLDCQASWKYKNDNISELNFLSQSSAPNKFQVPVFLKKKKKIKCLWLNYVSFVFPLCLHSRLDFINKCKQCAFRIAFTYADQVFTQLDDIYYA